jgi:RNA polymerase sigma-70 factor, ECF subfamily
MKDMMLLPANSTVGRLLAAFCGVWVVVQTILADVYQTESRRIRATLIRLLGDFDLAEEAMQDAFRVALEQWPQQGIPANPRTWLVSTGRFKAIDILRQRQRFDAALPDLATQHSQDSYIVGVDSDHVEDDRLRLMFTCCHPALQADVTA